MSYQESRKNKNDRIYKIFDYLDTKMPYSEIQQRLKIVSVVNSETIGNESVYTVQKAIEDLPYVDKIVETAKNSKEDVVYKQDLIVSLSGQAVDTVSIQVKSSLDKILKFYQKIDQDYYTAEEILIERKMIVLNGQLPQNVIKDFFIDKLSKINQYHQKNNK